MHPYAYVYTHMYSHTGVTVLLHKINMQPFTNLTLYVRSLLINPRIPDIRPRQGQASPPGNVHTDYGIQVRVLGSRIICDSPESQVPGIDLGGRVLPCDVKKLRAKAQGYLGLGPYFHSASCLSFPF